MARLEPIPDTGFDGIVDLAFSPDGSRLALAHGSSRGNAVAVLDLGTRRITARASPPGDSLVSGLSYSADGEALDTVVVGFDDGPAQFTRFDWRTGRRLLGPVAVNGGGPPR